MRFFNRMILICGLCCTAFLAQSQHWENKCGPVRGHWSDTLRSYSFLCKKSKIQDPVLTDFVAKNSAGVSVIQKDTIVLNKKYILLKYKMYGDFKTPPADSFSFIVGSCAFPYPILWLSGKKREVIFDRIREKNGEFMVWMGDNVYYLFGEWSSYRRMARVNINARSSRQIRQLLENQPNYAGWDDHDYGGNNSGINNPHKDLSLQIFKDFWMNPSYGQANHKGNYTRWTWRNAEFFLLDTRYHCSDTEMLGKEQMQWLQEGLRQSTADFKFVISPTQALTTNPTNEDWGAYSKEREGFLQFLEKERINGVLMISGDLHYGEWCKMERPNSYPLHEFTTSPMTSIVNPGYTRDNPLRAEGSLVLELNFGRVVIKGDICRFEMYNKEGKMLWYKEVDINNLQHK